MYLEEFYDYKNRFMEDILTDEAIVRLLDRNVPLEQAGRLIYDQVFPHEYIPEALEDAKTYICIDVDVQRVYNKTYLSPTIFVWVFTHKSLLRLPEGGVRIDRLVSEITKKMNGSRYYGIGELDLYSVKRFAPTMEYYGKVIAFNTTEFNRKSPTGQPVPGNRKTG